MALAEEHRLTSHLCDVPDIKTKPLPHDGNCPSASWLPQHVPALRVNPQRSISYSAKISIYSDRVSHLLRRSTQLDGITNCAVGPLFPFSGLHLPIEFASTSSDGLDSVEPMALPNTGCLMVLGQDTIERWCIKVNGQKVRCRSLHRATELFHDYAILAMNAYPVGTRVWFWQADGEVMYASVVASSTLADGTLMLGLRTDDGRNLTLPAAGVTQA